ncbi:hypothetical protein BSKO_02711 [Bryopsis sp. KO-2023]|nr:hypothetical protein BSKO_02711 [Bryopsis sp. KO-2023]
MSVLSFVKFPTPLGKKKRREISQRLWQVRRDYVRLCDSLRRNSVQRKGTGNQQQTRRQLLQEDSTLSTEPPSDDDHNSVRPELLRFKWLARMCDMRFGNLGGAGLPVASARPGDGWRPRTCHIDGSGVPERPRITDQRPPN